MKSEQSCHVCREAEASACGKLFSTQVFSAETSTLRGLKELAYYGAEREGARHLTCGVSLLCPRSLEWSGKRRASAGKHRAFAF